jgi:hypothetical protein
MKKHNVFKSYGPLIFITLKVFFCISQSNKSNQRLIGCHESEEQILNHCLNSTHLSSDCCSIARTQECSQSCFLLHKTYINSGTIKRKLKNKFMKKCKNDNKVIECSESALRNEGTIEQSSNFIFFK